MSVHTMPSGNYRVQWRDDDGKQRSKTFPKGRKREAEIFDGKIKERKMLGDLAALDAGRETLADYFAETWSKSFRPPARKTRELYAYLWDSHIAPTLGPLALRDLTVEIIARWQSDRLAAGAGPHAVNKALKLLGNVLQRAAEARRIPSNPARLVRKEPLPPSDEVRPLAPASVEALRAAMLAREESPTWRLWDAALIALLAYAGLRPQEARALRWRDIRDRTLIANAHKTRTRRTVRLLAPLKADLAEWRMACGRPADDAYVFPGENGNQWTADGYAQWRTKRFRPALKAAALPVMKPYALRHSFASLLAHEGRSAVYTARQLGHGPQLSLQTYQHVIEELEDAPRVSAEDAIRAARDVARKLPAGLSGGAGD